MRRITVVIGFCAVATACQQQAPMRATTADTPLAESALVGSNTPRPVTPPDALASQNTNWGSTVADVLEFKRKGNVLTAVGRLRNPGLVQMNFSSAYLIDETQGKKYQVLADETGNVIACCNGTTAMGENQTLNFWAKFPAPPADVKAVTLVLPETTPFDNLAIQDQ